MSTPGRTTRTDEPKKIYLPMIKKTIAALAFLTISLQVGAQEVVQMDKALFLKEVYDYENEPQWKYKGDRPAIIDLYADWCGPCRSIAPIMAELAKEYAGQIVVYKVNVDKERELATLFGASSIPLLVFVPQNAEPRLFRGAADKETYKTIVDDFLLNN